ncbi:MAG: NAD-binding protein, partial [Gemmatimonadota bacterium]
ARALARALERTSDGDDHVVLIDANANDVSEAEGEGFRVVFGNATEERTLRLADVESRRSLVALTPNEGVNLLLANRIFEFCGIGRRSVALDRRSMGVTHHQVHETGTRVLFGRPVDFERWRHALAQGNAVLVGARYGGPGRGLLEIPEGVGSPGAATLPLVHVRGNRADPVDDRTRVRTGERVIFAWTQREDAQARSWLAANGWEVDARA